MQRCQGGTGRAVRPPITAQSDAALLLLAAVIAAALAVAPAHAQQTLRHAPRACTAQDPHCATAVTRITAGGHSNASPVRLCVTRTTVR
jgi:hypothetical protein